MNVLDNIPIPPHCTKEITTVINLATGEERIYSLPARFAVIAAYEQSKGNNNTWEYPGNHQQLVSGKWTVACGDWCTKI